jgi:hypothetical protein
MVLENSAANVPVFTVQAGDVDVNNAVWSTLTWSISGAGDAFQIDPGSGQISVKANVIDYESASLYTFSVTAQDGGGLSVVSECTISVTDQNEVPVLTNQVRSVPENSVAGTSVGNPLPGSDPDVNQTAALVYTITSGNNAGIFEMDGAQLKVLVFDFRPVLKTTQMRTMNAGGTV